MKREQEAKGEKGNEQSIGFLEIVGMIAFGLIILDYGLSII